MFHHLDQTTNDNIRLGSPYLAETGKIYHLHEDRLPSAEAYVFYEIFYTPDPTKYRIVCDGQRIPVNGFGVF